MTNEMTSGQREAELKNLSKTAHTLLYERLTLAAALLGDGEWLANHDGSIDKAEAFLSRSYFSEFAGLVDFATLVACFRNYPEDVWQKHRFNVAAMESLYLEDHRKEAIPRGTRTHYKEVAEELQEKLSATKAEAATARREAKDLKKRMTELEKLQQENAELREENARLRGALEALKEQLGQRELAAV